MGTYRAVLKYHQRRNCFGYIQEQYSDIAQTTSIQISGSTSGAYNISKCKDPTNFGVIQIFVANDRCFHRPKVLFINKIFADLLGLRENEEVIVQEAETAPVCTLFEAELSSAEDWDIVQNSSQRIEQLLLRQVQLITVGRIYPIWIAKNLYIYFTVARIESSSTLMQNACLCEFTEVHVKPFCTNSNISVKNSSENLLGMLPMSFTSRMANLFSDISLMPFLFRIQNYCGNLKTATISRVLPEILLKDVFLLELDILAVFRLNYSQSKSEVITVSSVSNFETGKTTYALLIELSITSSHFVELRNCLKQYDPRHCVISPRLYQFISGEYEWIKISPLPKHHICQLGTLEVLSEGNVPENFNECLRNHLWKTCQHYPIIVPIDGLKMEMNLTSGARMQCHIRPRQDERTDQKPQKCFIFTNDVFPSLEYSNNESKKDSSVKLQRTNVSEDVHQVVANFGEWKNEAIEFSFQIAFIERYYAYITYHLENSIFSSSDNIFIVGNKSVGKTTILHLLAEKLFRSHLAVYSEYLYCSDWSGKTIEKFQDALKASVTRLRRRYPSVLFLDNLDFLLHSQDEDMRNVRLERCAELIRNLAAENNLLVVATACTKHEVIEFFSINAGWRFFRHVECIREFNPDEREECLKKFCNQKIEICGLQSAVETTGKCTISDLKRLAKRIVLESKVNGHEKIMWDDVQQALSGFRPNAMPIEHQKSVEMIKLQWEDVGGLKNVKQILTEVFIWPTKYPLLYRNSSIRLGRGVLLYGPSGCGKTLICKTLASQWHFNVISVKGPELLSKFIGESEENVRKIFGCARATSPCLIFFDEFDSLGPKRGEGDTGVSDRVVNQLLTELDGVEGLDDVYVIATTNRVDLIDGALLRPGRFDYIVKCELPRKEDRKSILEILCRGVNSENVDFELIAEATDGWTGADLKGLVTNAQLIAHKRISGALRAKDVSLNGHAKYTLCHQDLLLAIKDSQPNKKRSCSTLNRKSCIPAGVLTTLA